MEAEGPATMAHRATHAAPVHYSTGQGKHIQQSRVGGWANKTGTVEKPRRCLKHRRRKVLLRRHRRHSALRLYSHVTGLRGAQTRRSAGGRDGGAVECGECSPLSLDAMAHSPKGMPMCLGSWRGRGPRRVSVPGEGRASAHPTPGPHAVDRSPSAGAVPARSEAVPGVPGGGPRSDHPMPGTRSAQPPSPPPRSPSRRAEPRPRSRLPRYASAVPSAPTAIELDARALGQRGQNPPSACAARDHRRELRAAAAPPRTGRPAPGAAATSRARCRAELPAATPAAAATAATGEAGDIASAGHSPPSTADSPRVSARCAAGPVLHVRTGAARQHGRRCAGCRHSRRARRRRDASAAAPGHAGGPAPPGLEQRPPQPTMQQLR